VAQASDITIGLLLTGTAVFESYLSGAKSLFLDLEGYNSYAEYKTGKDVLVFDSIKDMLQNIDGIRKNGGPGSHVNLMEDIVRQKDPYRDGRASQRICCYIQWLLESFCRGEDRSQAISRANSLYRERWGADKVIEDFGPR